MSCFKGLQDDFGAEIGMRLTCQNCGKNIFVRQIGYNTIDAAVENTHRMFDDFEPVPDGWEIKHDLGGWCCPICAKNYYQMIKNFKLSCKDSEEV